MPINNLPLDYLYQKLPEGVISEDIRDLLKAVISGYQDSTVDFRALAGQIQQIWNPNNSIGEPYQVLLLTYLSQGSTVTTELNPNETTPSISDTTAINQWCANQAGIDINNVISVSYQTEINRTAEVRTLLLLADTLGANLYPIYGQNSDQQIINQKRVMSGYFARLKIKGTKTSFEILGKLHGFDDTKFIPLWGRVSPRAPSEVNSVINDPDFNSVPQGQPTPGQITLLYNPQILNDGDLFVWTSDVLGITQGQSDFSLDQINGFNPYVNILSVNSTLKIPAAGTYYMTGGAPGVKALSQIIPATDGTPSGFQFQAIAESSSFNSAQIIITNVTNSTGQIKFQVQVFHNLSTVKFVTSYFNLVVTQLLTNYAAQFQFPVPASADLTAEPSLWSSGNSPQPVLAVSFNDYGEGQGIAIPPYFPWTGGSKLNPLATAWPQFEQIIRVGSGSSRFEADVNNLIVDATALIEGQNVLAGNINDVRPATRYLRQLNIGFGINPEQVSYAPFPFGVTLTNISSIGNYNGTAGTAGINYPTSTYTGVFYISYGGNSFQISAEYDPLNLTLINLKYLDANVSLNGTYNLTTAQYSITVTSITSACSISAVWESMTTENIQETTRTLLQI